MIPPGRVREWTELDLAMTRNGAEEWPDLADIDDDDTVLPPLPLPLPLTVRAVDVWTVRILVRNLSMPPHHPSVVPSWVACLSPDPARCTGRPGCRPGRRGPSSAGRP